MTTPTIPPAMLDAATQGEMKVHRDQAGLITLYIGSLGEKQIADMALVGAGQGGTEEELANAELLAASWNACRKHDIAKLQAAADALPGLAAALEESLALNINWSADADAETLAYYSEYKAVIKQAQQALAAAKGAAQ